MLTFKKRPPTPPEVASHFTYQKVADQRPWLRRHKVWAGGLAAGVILLGGLTIFGLANNHGKFGLLKLFASAIRVSTGHAAQIKGQDRGRTNLLVYGMTQDGLRTDSIILVSYYWQQKKVVTLNIPRDLYVYDGYENDKMGEIYAYAKARQPKNPTYPDTYVASIIAKEYGIPIDYWVQFNMQGEVDFINAIGGITINVPAAFTDYQYPTANYSGYVRPAPHFNAGLQHMNGASALIYSRSRHSLDNGQGSDFARSNRQAQVIQAATAKLKSLGIIGNLTQITHYLNILGDNITTSMSTDDMVSFAKTLKNLSPSSDLSHGNWSTGNGFLCDSSTASGAYVVLYGAVGNCRLGAGAIGAGGFHNSTYRKLAVYYVQNLLASAALSPTAFTTQTTSTLQLSPVPSPTVTGQ